MISSRERRADMSEPSSRASARDFLVLCRRRIFSSIVSPADRAGFDHHPCLRPLARRLHRPPP